MSTKRWAPKSLTDLPSEVLVEIIARLPLRTLVVSRSVCTKFLSLSTHNPLFVTLHFANAAQIVVLQFGASLDPPSYLLRLADPELDQELKPLFQLPSTGRRGRLYPTDFRDENRLFLANSCKGLLYFFRRLPEDDDCSLVCNPVTNEYIIIPDVDMKIRLDSPIRSMWLGFSPGSNQYKVLRLNIFSCVYWNNTGYKFKIEYEVKAQVFVIGSESWRDVDDTPPGRQLSFCLCSTQVNGFMYWFDLDWTDLIFFDFETEKFGEIALPAELQQLRNKQYNSIGVLGGFLCLSCNDFDAQSIDLWLMRDQNSWTKEFVVDTSSGPVHGYFNPLQFLRNGEILMHWWANDLVCYHPRTKTLRYFGLHKRLRLPHKHVPLTPSFVPLKDTLKVGNVLRQYVRPRGDEKEELWEEEENK